MGFSFVLILSAPLLPIQLASSSLFILLRSFPFPLFFFFSSPPPSSHAQNSSEGSGEEQDHGDVEADIEAETARCPDDANLTFLDEVIMGVSE